MTIMAPRNNLVNRLSSGGARFKALPLGSKIALSFLVIIAILAAFAPLIAPHDPLATGIPAQKPGAEHFFGTDRLGREIYSRLLYGAQASLSNDPTVKNTREVAQLAQAGDEHAHTALSVGGMAVGSAAASLANVLDPQTLVLAGGMAEAGAIWWEAVHAGFVASAIDALAQTPLLPATLGTDAALLGAASLFWNEEFEENVDVA